MRRAGSNSVGDVDAEAASLPALDTSLDNLDGSTHQAFLDLTAAANAAGLFFNVRSTRRTCAQQAEQFAIGRQPGDTRKIVTKAQGCVSWHVSGRAVDVTMTQGSYADLGALAKTMSWKWGGDFPGFPDPGHIEYHPGMTIEQVCPNPAACSDDLVGTTWPVGGGADVVNTTENPAAPAAFLFAAAAAVALAVVWSRS